METQEALEMMTRCREEILSLRRTIDRLTPKAEAYDHLTKVLNLLPERSQGVGIDLAWSLQKRIEELSKPEVADDRPDFNLKGEAQ